MADRVRQDARTRPYAISGEVLAVVDGDLRRAVDVERR
jgi:hypothetical protein